VKELCDSGQDALIVRVSTDAGITGIGEVDSAAAAVKGLIEGPFYHTTAAGLRELLIGEDPFETEYLWYKMYRGNIYAGRRGVGIHAMSGIDIALWDIKGKALDVYVVIQRPWASDPAGTVKIGRYAVATGTWSFVSYTLDAVTLPAGGFVGLSEITELPNGTFAIIERDNQAGTSAQLKKVYGVDLATANFQPFVAGTPLAVVGKTLLADVLDEIDANSIWTPDKLEGLAVAADGDVYIVTDNDGLDVAIGQTVFLGRGPVATALAG
jgi:hypothetical protein